MDGKDPRALGRLSAAVLSLLFLAAGVVLLGAQVGWWSFDFWRWAVPLGLLVAGALFLAHAVLGHGWRDPWDMALGPGGARGPWDDDRQARHGGIPWIGRYWMGVMAVFFVVMALGVILQPGGRSLWYLSGPFFLVAVGGMFILRALGWCWGPGAGAAGGPGAPRPPGDQGAA